MTILRARLAFLRDLGAGAFSAEVMFDGTTLPEIGAVFAASEGVMLRACLPGEVDLATEIASLRRAVEGCAQHDKALIVSTQAAAEAAAVKIDGLVQRESGLVAQVAALNRAAMERATKAEREMVAAQTELDCISDVVTGSRPAEDFEPAKGVLGEVIIALRAAAVAAGNASQPAAPTETAALPSPAEPTFDTADLYSCRDEEHLSLESPQEAIAEWLDGWMSPGCDVAAIIAQHAPVEVIAYARETVDDAWIKRLALRLAEDAAENLGEEFGDPDGGGDDIDAEALALRLAPQLRSAIDGVVIWACKRVGKKSLAAAEIEALMREHNPEWFVPTDDESAAVAQPGERPICNRDVACSTQAGGSSAQLTQEEPRAPESRWPAEVRGSATSEGPPGAAGPQAPGEEPAKAEQSVGIATEAKESAGATAASPLPNPPVRWPRWGLVGRGSGFTAWHLWMSEDAGESECGEITSEDVFFEDDASKRSADETCEDCRGVEEMIDATSPPKKSAAESNPVAANPAPWPSDPGTPRWFRAQGELTYHLFVEGAESAHCDYPIPPNGRELRADLAAPGCERLCAACLTAPYPEAGEPAKAIFSKVPGKIPGAMTTILSAAAQVALAHAAPVHEKQTRQHDHQCNGPGCDGDGDRDKAKRSTGRFCAVHLAMAEKETDPGTCLRLWRADYESKKKEAAAKARRAAKTTTAEGAA